MDSPPPPPMDDDSENDGDNNFNFVTETIKQSNVGGIEPRNTSYLDAKIKQQSSPGSSISFLLTGEILKSSAKTLRKTPQEKKKKVEKDFIKDNILRSKTPRSGVKDPNNTNPHFYNNRKNLATTQRDRTTSYFHSLNADDFQHPHAVNQYTDRDRSMNISDLDLSVSSAGGTRKKSKKKKPLYAWEAKPKESEAERQIRISQKSAKRTEGTDYKYHPDEQHDGYYLYREAIPPPSYVDFRIIFSAEDFDEFNKKKKIVDQQRRHINRVKKSREKQIMDKENTNPFYNPKYSKLEASGPNPYVDRKLIEKSLFRAWGGFKRAPHVLVHVHVSDDDDDGDFLSLLPIAVAIKIVALLRF